MKKMMKKMAKMLNMETKANGRIAPFNPVELTIGWCQWFVGLFTATWLCCGVEYWMDSDEGVIISFVASAIMMGLLWSPGLVACAFADTSKDCLTRFSSTYASSGGNGIFTEDLGRCINRYRITWKRGYVGLGTYLTLFLSAPIVIGDIASLFDRSAIYLSFVAGFFLSIGGFVVIVFRICRDFIREIKGYFSVF